jgi:uncharacterized protein (DUF1501 family)
MFTVNLGRSGDCQSPDRRDVLKVGALGGMLGGLGLSLPTLLRAQAAAPDGSRDVNCILLWMQGGPSHHETFDPKPDAPAEIRGEFGTVATSVPGVHFSEHLPRTARVADRFALLRSFNPQNGSHGTADAQMMTGQKFNPSLTFPCYGSVVARQKGYNRGLPPFVQVGNSIDRRFGGGVAGFLGNALNPFEIPGDPSAKGFSVRDVTPPGGVSYGRLERRLGMLAQLDDWQKRTEQDSDAVESMDAFYRKAHSMITSPAAKAAFDLAAEPDKVRDAYGRNRLGQSCLLARRLVEAGVRFVTVTDGGWDTHQNNFNSLKDRKLPPLDQAFPALLEDLAARGMLDNTLVVWMGDFGRTPKINSAAGRDHWATAGNVIFAGAGVRGGTVVGGTDKTGAAPEGKEHYTPDVAATIYDRLGVPLDLVFETPDGRPIHLCHGNVISDVL